jgi:lipoprotein signal peptidase
MLNCNLLVGFSSYQLYNLFSFLILILLVSLALMRIRVSISRNLAILVLTIGGIGNIAMRQVVTKGCVWDPWNFFGLFRFNAFDALLTAGVAVLLYLLYTQTHD